MLRSTALRPRSMLRSAVLPSRRQFAAMRPEARSMFDMILGRSRSKKVPLDEPFEMDFSIQESTRQPAPIVAPAEISSLPNGIRVISTSSMLPGSSVGLLIAAGSRYSPKPGLPHILAGLALQSTSSRSEMATSRTIEELGGQFHAEANRDQILLRADVLRSDISPALEIITDVAINGAFDVTEVSNRVETYRHQVGDVISKNMTLQIEDSLHSAAFAGRGPGLPLHASSSAEVQSLNAPDELRAYRNATFRPDRMVVVGAGVTHRDLVQIAERLLGDFKAAGEPVGSIAAPYVGAGSRCNKPTADGFAHVALGFAAGGLADIVPACALSMLMGGGGSFSAGGPGKGMYSRLYLRVLTGNPWVHSAQCTTSVSGDTTLLSLHGMSNYEDAGKLAGVLIREAKAMAGNLTDQEVNRAKNQLKSSLYMNLESRHILFEDLGQQILKYNERSEPDALAAKIDALTIQDISRVAKTMLSQQPTVVAKGDIRYKVPDHNDIVQSLK